MGSGCFRQPQSQRLDKQSGHHASHAEPLNNVSMSSPARAELTAMYSFHLALKFSLSLALRPSLALPLSQPFPPTLPLCSFVLFFSLPVFFSPSLSFFVCLFLSPMAVIKVISSARLEESATSAGEAPASSWQLHLKEDGPPVSFSTPLRKIGQAETTLVFDLSSFLKGPKPVRLLDNSWRDPTHSHSASGPASGWFQIKSYQNPASGCRCRCPSCGYLLSDGR